MKKIITVLYLLVTATCFAQEQNKIIPVDYIRLAKGPIKSIDSFLFCSAWYQIPRECDAESEANCCSATMSLNKNDISCYSGVGLFWEYLPSEKAAKDDLEMMLPQIERQRKYFKKEKTTCYIAGKELPAVKIISETKDGFILYEIHTYGTINAQPVLIKVWSETEIFTNDDIPKGVRQIFTLTK